MQGRKGITSHVCCFREEWQWLQTLACLQKSGEMGPDTQPATHRLQDELNTAIKDLMAHINLPGSQVRGDLSLCFTETIKSRCRGLELLLTGLTEAVRTYLVNGGRQQRI